MADETVGVGAIGRMLARLAEQPGETVGEIAVQLGIARSTAFAVVAQCEAAGFMERDAVGRVYPGPTATRLALAHYGFGAMAPTLSALLPVLRDDTDASASLHLSRDDSLFMIAERRAAWDSEGAPSQITAPIGRSATGFHAALHLALRPHAGEAEIRSASASLDRVAEALRTALATG